MPPQVDRVFSKNPLNGAIASIETTDVIRLAAAVMPQSYLHSIIAIIIADADRLAPVGNETTGVKVRMHICKQARSFHAAITRSGIRCCSLLFTLSSLALGFVVVLIHFTCVTARTAAAIEFRTLLVNLSPCVSP